MRARLAHLIKNSPLRGVATALDNRLAILKGARKGYSQHGEDRFVLDYFKGKPGTYVDIGANHPIKISNTYLLYRHGWSGLTVEPIERLSLGHLALRPRDKHVRGLVGPAGKMKFFQMHGTGHSTVLADRGASMMEKGGVEKTIELDVVPLSELIDRHLPGKSLQMLTVDTEGFDLQVLRSGNWTRHRPKLVIFESDEDGNAEERQTTEFLQQFGYKQIQRLGCNVVLESSDA